MARGDKHYKRWSKRESVWLETDVMHDEQFAHMPIEARFAWLQIGYMLDDDHALPAPADIALSEWLEEPLERAAAILDELQAAGFIEARGDRWYMTAHSQRFYTFTQAEAEAREATAYQQDGPGDTQDHD